jgi:hypothetical protein
MKKAVFILLATITSAAVSMPAATATKQGLGAPEPHAVQQSLATEAKQCRPSILGLLVEIGWAYATKSPALVSGTRPCQDNTPKAQQNPSDQEDKSTTPSQTPTKTPSGRMANLPADEALRKARLLLIRPRSSWFNREKLERELLKRKEFGELRLELTRDDNQADLILEITRKIFTTRFTCSVIEPSASRILAAVTASSLGGEIEPHLADAIIKQFKTARSKPAVEQTTSSPQ